jgi:Plasmid pRiA4b ORF-3-like protein
MPTVYRFRVTFEDYDETYRDIAIKSTQTFEDLHQIIQSSIGFDASKPASFYMSNDNWIKGDEISTEVRVNKQGEKSVLMHDSRICDFITDPHQKIYYISDYDVKWTFFIELFKLLPKDDISTSYPSCIKSSGEAPRQYAIAPQPKNIIAEEGELDKLFDVLGADDEVEEEEDTLIETEEGVDADEIAGMEEEGEDDVEEGDEEEMSISDDDDQNDED